MTESLKKSQALNPETPVAPTAEKEAPPSPTTGGEEKRTTGAPKAKTEKAKVKDATDAAKSADEAAQVFYDEPTARDKKRMELMVESLYYIHDATDAKVQLFTSKIEWFAEQIGKLVSFSDVLPDDCIEPLEKAKEQMAWYMRNPPMTSPAQIVERRKVLIGWKARLGELIAKYKPKTVAYELGYYSLRGAAFVALSHVGRSLEQNIKHGTTVKDREQQSQVMTLGIAQERVYFDFVVETLIQNQRAIADMIDNMEQELIELRHQRRTESSPSY